MEERPLDMMISPPTTEKMDDITEQLAKCMAGVRINATKWASGKFGCLPLALEDEDLTITTKNTLTSNERLPKPTNFHADISNDTRQKYTLCLTKEHNTVRAAYHIQESATEVSVSMLVANIKEQHLVDLDEQYVGFHNQTQLSILVHLTKTWAKVHNQKKVVSTDAFKLLWGYHPTMHIKTYSVELNKRQRAMKKLKVQ